MYFVWMNMKWMECDPDAVAQLTRGGYEVIERDEPPRSCQLVYDYKPDIYGDEYVLPFFTVGMEAIERYLAAL